MTERRPARDAEEQARAAVPGPRAAARASGRAGGRAGGRGRGAVPQESGTRSRRRPKRFRKTKITALSTALLLVVLAGAGWAYWEHLNGNITSSQRNSGDDDVPKSKPDAFGRTPLNILLLGSDSRDSQDDCKLGGTCDTGAPHADVEMLLHVSADRSNASIVSVPRDTRVEIPACTDEKTKKRFPASEDIIADSLNNAGPGCVVAAWQKLTGVHIDHFMMVNFSGVVSMADAVGGVEVCVDNNIKDSQQYTDAQGVHHDIGSHLKLPKGKSTIKGEQALEWLRTRHAFEYGGDVGRAKAQHMYMNAMMRKLKSAGTLANPTKVLPLAEAATKALHVDDGLDSLNKLISLAETLNKVPTNRMTMTTMPNVADPQNKDGLVPAPSADRLWQMLRDDVPFDKNGPAPTQPPAAAPAPPAPAPPTSAPPQVDKSSVRIQVRNGTSADNRAGSVTDALVADGYTRAVTTTSPPHQSTTTLLYPAEQKDDAQAVAASLGLPDSALTESSEATRLTLTIGADWTSGTHFGGGDATASNGSASNGSGSATPTPGPSSTAPAAGDLPSDVDQLNAATDDNKCMHVNTAKDSNGVPIYIW